MANFREDGTEENLVADALFTAESKRLDLLAMPELRALRKVADEPARELRAPLPMGPCVIPLSELKIGEAAVVVELRRVRIDQQTLLGPRDRLLGAPLIDEQAAVVGVNGAVHGFELMCLVQALLGLLVHEARLESGTEIVPRLRVSGIELDGTHEQWDGESHGLVVRIERAHGEVQKRVIRLNADELFVKLLGAWTITRHVALCRKGEGVVEISDHGDAAGSGGNSEYEGRGKSGQWKRETKRLPITQES
ncbi:hypothetical protein UFOVP1244_32 [uncultured Caudovirales phage]|uniref:Uncharacterized protein n=1 Tax=uncultured Caudovirales phage TaxID=2100421 RepID=A0A6J5R6M1_9CAUD|nr:hypothetical protein UFOVP1244_32 [uncultured Caudovirales phage]